MTVLYNWGLLKYLYQIFFLQGVDCVWGQNFALPPSIIVVCSTLTLQENALRIHQWLDMTSSSPISWNSLLRFDIDGLRMVTTPLFQKSLEALSQANRASKKQMIIKKKQLKLNQSESIVGSSSGNTIPYTWRLEAKVKVCRKQELWRIQGSSQPSLDLPNNKMRERYIQLF